MVAESASVKRIALSTRLDPQVTIIRADERRLTQILINLLSNAVKFTPTGGSVGLEVNGNVEQQTVTFTVWDTGIGIAEENLPRLFKPFTQIDSGLNRQYGGTGLGLALVDRLVRAHQGSVAVASTLGQGSRFSVTLPWQTVPVNSSAREIAGPRSDHAGA
jgi:signal transduction histidine kinase